MRLAAFRLATTMMLLISVTMTGCAGAPSAAPMSDGVRSILDAVEVHRLAFGDSFGTGVHIGGNRILTCQHVVQGNAVEVDGHLAIFRTLAEGAPDGEDESESDWAIIQLMTLELDTPSVLELWRGDGDPGHADVLFKAYFYPGGVTRKEAYETPITWMEGRLVPAPDGRDSPAMIYAQIDAPETPRGGSGGPMFSYDPVTNEVALRGIYVRPVKKLFLGVTYQRMLLARATTGELADALRTYGTYD